MSVTRAALWLWFVGCASPDDRPTDRHEPPRRCGPDAVAGAPDYDGSTVYLGGDGYPVYRIPALVTTSSGVVLAFAEGRQTFADPGAGLIDVVMRRSDDCGQTWSDVETLAENGEGDAHNPTAVVDASGRVWLFYGTRPASAGGEFDLPSGLGDDSSKVWFITSDDDGGAWSDPVDITAQVKNPEESIVTPGPGRAIVTRWGAAPGRLLVPGWYFTPAGLEGSLVLWSDDGETWTRTDLPAAITNEAQLVERTDGAVLLDGRQQEGARRHVFRSDDAGASFGPPVDGLPMAAVMSGTTRLLAQRSGDDRDLLLHTGVDPTGRYDLRVWLSEDEGDSWGQETLLEEGFAQYSLSARLDDGSIGLVYEGNAEGAVFDIRFRRFDLSFIEAATQSR